MADVLCLGEILVDWVCTTEGAELERAEVFIKAPGGAPANTAVSLERQGIKTAFLGRIACDHFGFWLRDMLVQNGVDISGLIEDPDAQTRMAYVVTINGDRKLAEFTKIDTADARFKPGDLKPEMFATASILHFGSISLIDPPIANATKQAIKLAKKNKMLVSYDPNIRIGLWQNSEKCRQKILETLCLADVVKINEDELQFLTGSQSMEAANCLREKNNIALLLITLGAQGAVFVHACGTKTVSGFQIKLKDATGAGDGFNSGILAGLLHHINHREKKSDENANRRSIIESLTLDELENIVKRANAIGALTCTKVGAIPALPTCEEVELLLRH